MMNGLKRRWVSTLFIIAILLACISPIVLAAWEYSFPTYVLDTSGTSRAYYPVFLGYGSQRLVDAGKIAASGLDTNMQVGTTDVKYMMSASDVVTAIPVLPNLGLATATLYTGYTPNQSSFSVITGNGGYETFDDVAALELGGDGGIEINSYLDTTAGSNKYLVEKASAVTISVDDTVSGTINAEISSAGTSTTTLRPNGVGDMTNINTVVGAATHWQAVDDVAADDAATYVKENRNFFQEYDFYTLEDWPFASDLTIVSVTVYIRGYIAGGPTASVFRGALRLGGVTVDAPAYNDLAWTTHNDVVARPGGGTWTTGDIDDLQVGIRLTDNTNDARATQVYVVVTYENKMGLTASGISSGDHITALQLGDTTGNQLHFDGTANSYVDCGALYNAQAKFWLSLWFKLDSDWDNTAPANKYLFTKTVDANNFTRLYLSTDGAVHWGKTTGGAADFDIASAETSWTAGTWYNVVASISSVNAVRLRIDGGVAVTDADVSALTNGGNIYIGAEPVLAATSGVVGVMTDVIVGTDDLAGAEEVDLSDGVPPGDETNFWPLDEGSGAVAYSYGADLDNGTIGLSCTWTEGSKHYTFSILIDGTLEDSQSLRGYTVTNNGNDWILGQNNAMPYMDYYKHTVGGTLVAHYEPNTMILGDAATTYPSIVGTNSGTNTSGTSHTVDLPTRRMRDNLLLVFFATTSNPTITYPTGWTSLFSTATGANGRLSAAYRIATGDEDAVITVTTSASVTSSYQTFSVTSYQGTPEVGTAATGAGAANPDSPNLAPSWGATTNLWFALCEDDVNVTDYPAGYTGVGVAGTTPYIASAYIEASGAAENPGVFTAAIGNWVANTLAVRGKGTATFTNGSTAVTGAGTDWTELLEGSMIQSDTDGVWHVVSTVASTTSLTLTGNYSGAGGAGHDFTTAVRLPDREGAAQDAALVWGSNDDIRISQGEMGVSSVSELDVSIGGFVMPDAPLPDTWFASGTGASDLPFYDAFNVAATSIGLPVQQFYLWAIIGFALGFAVLTIVMTRSALLGVMIMTILLFVGSSMTIIPMWIPFIVLIIDIGIMFLYKQVAY